MRTKQVLDRMQARLAKRPDILDRRRELVEHPFRTIKQWMNQGSNAFAASILTAAYHMLRDGTFYQDLGANHFHRASAGDRASHLARQIAKLGFTCVLTPATERPVSV